MIGNSSETDRLLQGAAQGDKDQWGALLAQHWERLRRMVAQGLHRLLQGRIDASGVIQEACLTLHHFEGASARNSWGR